MAWPTTLPDQSYPVAIADSSIVPVWELGIGVGNWDLESGIEMGWMGGMGLMDGMDGGMGWVGWMGWMGWMDGWDGWKGLMGGWD